MMQSFAKIRTQCASDFWLINLDMCECVIMNPKLLILFQIKIQFDNAGISEFYNRVIKKSYRIKKQHIDITFCDYESENM